VRISAAKPHFETNTRADSASRALARQISIKRATARDLRVGYRRVHTTTKCAYPPRRSIQANCGRRTLGVGVDVECPASSQVTVAIALASRSDVYSRRFIDGHCLGSRTTKRSLRSCHHTLDLWVAVASVQVSAAPRVSKLDQPVVALSTPSYLTLTGKVVGPNVEILCAVTHGQVSA